MRRIIPSAFLAFLLLSVVVVTAISATYVTNTTPSGKPAWLSPGWFFTATSDTAFGESVCVEVHPQGDAGNYVRTQCDYLGGSPPNVNWTCSVFTGGVPTAFKSKTVEYQFFVADSGTSCGTNTEAWTGFNWTFGTGSNAVLLRSLKATTALPFVGATVVVLGGLGGLALWRRRK